MLLCGTHKTCWTVGATRASQALLVTLTQEGAEAQSRIRMEVPFSCNVPLTWHQLGKGEMLTHVITMSQSVHKKVDLEQ